MHRIQMDWEVRYAAGKADDLEQSARNFSNIHAPSGVHDHMAGGIIGSVTNGAVVRMITQTLTIGKRRFVAVPECDFQRLQKRADEGAARAEFAEEAMRELKAYRKTGKAASWIDLKGKLGL